MWLAPDSCLERLLIDSLLSIQRQWNRQKLADPCGCQDHRNLTIVEKLDWIMVVRIGHQPS